MFLRGDVFKVSEYLRSTNLQHNGFVGRGELFSAEDFCWVVKRLIISYKIWKYMTISNHNYTTLGVYRPPSSSSTAFNYNFPLVLTNLNNNVVILVDFNVDLCASSYLSFVNAFIDMFVYDCYDSLINISTRVPKDSRNCLDHTLVKSSFQYKSGVNKSGITDHYATFCSLSIKHCPTQSYERVYFRDDSLSLQCHGGDIHGSISWQNDKNNTSSGDGSSGVGATAGDEAEARGGGGGEGEAGVRGGGLARLQCGGDHRLPAVGDQFLPSPHHPGRG